MTEGLVLPGRRVPAPLPPERIALDMAFGVGNPAILGDKSRYNSHGAITTAAVAAGLHGLCLDFNPLTPDYVTIPAAHTQLDFTAEDFSIVLRVNPDILPATAILFVRGNVNADGYEFFFDGAGTLQFRTNQVAANQVTTSALGAIAAGAWQTIGLSRSGASAAIYVNGVQSVGAPGVHINPLTSARNCYIGIWQDAASFPVDGRIEFYRVFRGVELIGSEHLAWHNALA